MAEQGFILDIDTQFLQRLEKADKALDKMVSSVDRVASSLDGFASGSLSKFANSIDQIVASINGLSQTKVGDMGFSEATNSVSQTVDKVNDLVGAIREVSNESAKSSLSFDVSDYESPAKVQALIEKNRAAFERAQTRLPKWEGRLSESLKTDPELSKKSTQGVAMRVKEINDEIKALNDTYNQLSQRLVVAKERTQELLDASRKGGFKDIATMTAIKEAQKERIESGGFSARAEQQKYVDAYVDANDQIKEQYKSTIEALNDEDKARYELWLMQKHTEAKEHNRIEDEKHEKTLEKIRRQNEEYDKQETLQKSYDKQNLSAKDGGNEARENYARQMHEYEKMYDAIDKKRRKNEQEEEASIAREDAANKRKAQSVIDNYIKETNAARASYEKRQKMYEDLFKQQEEQERRTLSGAMGFSKGAGSISERQQAIKYLSEARDSLNESQFNSAKEYKQAVGAINKEINRQKTYVDELRDKHNSLINTADQLKRAFTLAFSVSAIRGYVNQIIRVRGEFELQQRALQAILKNKEEANKLWDQTTQLAVRSPYQVKELVTYTKQLAAYRVETEKLHDTTKMLADISSGLGVDMGRLILAFGQVKAANYLRGTELRQFSEAGINILDELARYYTAVEGKAVTVGQVFERVSKRMVTFSDVETVLRNVTSAGGMFYKMQEIQAETLKGSISNLKDQLDLMLNDIGKSNEGTIKLSVKLVGLLISNYKALIPVISMATIAFVGMNVSMLKVKLGARALAAGMNTLKSSLVNPWAIALVAIGRVVSSFVEYRHELNEIEKEHKRLADSLYEISIAMNDAIDAQKIEDARIAMSRLSELAENDFGIDLGLSEEDIRNMDLSSLQAKLDELKINLFDSNTIAESLKNAYAFQSSYSETTFGRILRGIARQGDPEALMRGESFAKDVEQYQRDATELVSTLNSAALIIQDKLKLPADDDLRKLRQENETELDYIERLIRAYKSHREAIENAGIDTRDVQAAIDTYEERLKDVEAESTLFFNAFSSLFATKSDLVIKGAINSFVSSTEWNNLTREVILRGLGLDATPNGVDGNTNKNKNKNGLNGDKNNRDTRWQDLLRTIKEVNKAYKDLNQTFDETTARQGVMEKYSDALNDVLGKLLIDGKKLTATEFMSMFDLTNEEGFKAALDMIAKDAPDAADKLKAKLEKGEITWEAKIKTKEESDKELIQDIEDLFSGYELSIELDKLNVPKDFAKSLFGIEAFSLPEVREKVEAREGEFVGTAQEDKYKDFLKKLSDLETKEQQERLEKYLVYARNSVGERAKIKLEEMKKLQEIELAFAPKVGETAEERTIRETAKASAIEGVKAESYQQTKKQEWEDFQKSDTFISIFQDLDMASETLLNHAIAKLREFRSSWTDMPHEEMKSIVQNIEKLELELSGRDNPFQNYRDLRDQLKGVGSIEELQADNIIKETRIEALDKELEISEQVLSLRQEGKDVEADILAIENNQADLFGLSAKETKDVVDSQKDLKKQLQDQVSLNNANISKWKQFYGAIAKSADKIQAIQKMAHDLYDAFSELNSVIGDDDGPAAIFAEMGMSMADSVINCLLLQGQLASATEGAMAFGSAMNTAMGIIGWIVMAVQLITSVLKAVFAAHDNRLEKQIERISERVEVLQKQFEKLEEAMDRAFSLDQVSRYSEEAKKNMESQIQGYQQMIALEEDKKKTDHEKIKEWEEAMEEVQEQYDELMEEGFNLVTSDILSDVMGAARDFVDAWHDAFIETGDGLSGLEQNFTDMFKELMRQQAAMSIVGPYVESFKDQLKQFVDFDRGDTTLTAEEAREWAEMVKGTFPEISALLQSFFEGTQDLMQEQGELSELSKGIQGVTESTAQVLEALLNSMRFYVADSNMRLQNIEAAFASEEVSRNPILNELRQQTQMIRSIESMFDSVIGRGGSLHAGAYLKVSM